MRFTTTNLGNASPHRWLPIIVLSALCVVAHGADELSKVSAKLKSIPACSNLLSAAELNRVPLAGMDSWGGTNALRAGDSATVLITFVQKTKQTQWLLHLETTDPDPTKAAQKTSTFVVNSSFGPPE